MGADLLLGIAKWNRTVPTNDEGDINQSINTLNARIDALSRDTLVSCAEQACMPEDEWSDEGVRAYLKQCVQELIDERRDTAFVSIEGSTYLITGGMSWGDHPTDAYPMVCAIEASGITIEQF